MDWEGQGVRLVLYPSKPGSIPDAAAVWRELFAPREPEITQRPSNVLPGMPTSMAAGPIRGVGFTVTVAPLRLDVLMGRHGAAPWTPGDGTAPTMEALLEPAVHYGTKALELFEVGRVAIVVDALQGAETWEEAHDKFRKELNFIPECKGVRQLNFQVNVIRPFEVDKSACMNRLCQWQTAVFQLLTVQAGTGSHQISNQHHALSLQLDLSSDVEVKSLESVMAKAMLEEIGQEHKALLADGFERLAS